MSKDIQDINSKRVDTLKGSHNASRSRGKGTPLKMRPIIAFKNERLQDSYAADLETVNANMKPSHNQQSLFSFKAADTLASEEPVKPAVLSIDQGSMHAYGGVNLK